MGEERKAVTVKDIMRDKCERDADDCLYPAHETGCFFSARTATGMSATGRTTISGA